MDNTIVESYIERGQRLEQERFNQQLATVLIAFTEQCEGEPTIANLIDWLQNP